jgi:hypothetical protein
MRRLWVAGALITALAVLTGSAGLAATAASASTAADTVVITAFNSPSADRGQFSVSVTSTTSLTNLAITLASATNPDVLSLPFSDFTLASGTDMLGTWTLTSPVTEAELPLGIYTVNITASDSGGGSATVNTRLDWLIHPTITLNASQTTFSYDHPSITFSGTATGTSPDGTVAPLAGQSMVLTDNDNADLPITTGGDGSFQITVAQPDNFAAYYVINSETATVGFAESPMINVTAIQDPAQVTAKVSATQLNYGQTLTISGTATYNPGSGFVPLTDSPVQIYGGPAAEENFQPFMTATTDSSGNYSVSFPDKGSGQFYVYAGGMPQGGWSDQVLSPAAATTPSVNVAIPVQVTGLRASLSPFAVLTLRGCLVDSFDAFGAALPLHVEYASRPNGPWKVLRSVNGIEAGTTCGSGPEYGAPFDYKVPVRVAAAYYRLSYAGSKDYEPMVSKAVYEAKTVTRITNFRVSPHKTAAKKYVRVSGRLWKYTRSWHPLSRQHVWILFHYRGQWYYYGHRPVTNSSGRFSGRFKLYVSAPWVAEYRGSKTYFACASRRIKVTATRPGALHAARQLPLAPVRMAGLRILASLAGLAPS